MDALTLSKPTDAVAKDVNTITEDEKMRGLQLNITKCDLISNHGISSPVMFHLAILL
jgi:hypothetical protein